MQKDGLSQRERGYLRKIPTKHRSQDAAAKKVKEKQRQVDSERGADEYIGVAR